MKRTRKDGNAPSQRQLRAGELVRHALSDLLAQGSAHDPALDGFNVTVTEVRVTPDLKRATAYVTSLGGDDDAAALAALTRSAKRLRGLLGRELAMKFTPQIEFRRDDRFDRAQRLDDLLRRPEVRRDVEGDGR